MEPLATADDLSDALARPLTEDEAVRADRWLMTASSLLRQATRQTIDTRIGLFATAPTDPRAVDPVLAASVVATVVKRFVNNVSGATSTSHTAGPFAESVSYVLRGDKSGIRGEMVVTDDDLEKLAPEVPAQVGSITVGASPALTRGMAETFHKAGQVYGPAGTGDAAGRSGRIW